VRFLLGEVKSVNATHEPSGDTRERLVTLASDVVGTVTITVDVAGDGAKASGFVRRAADGSHHFPFFRRAPTSGPTARTTGYHDPGASDTNAYERQIEAFAAASASIPRRLGTRWMGSRCRRLIGASSGPRPRGGADAVNGQGLLGAWASSPHVRRAARGGRRGGAGGRLFARPLELRRDRFATCQRRRAARIRQVRVAFEAAGCASRVCRHVQRHRSRPEPARSRPAARCG